jgi:UDP-glucose:(heptosyl)LPS alpha-1,3-glucosyltransferase
VRIALTYPDVTLVGGVDRVIVEVANQLAGGGHSVRVYGSTFEDGVLDDAVIRRPVPVPRRPDVVRTLAYHRRAGAALARDAADTDVHGAFSALSPPGGVFWVPSVHAAAYDLVMSRRGAAGRLVQAVNPYHRARLSLERRMFSARGARRLLAASDAVRGDIHRYYGVPEADIGVVPLGYDERRFSATRRAELREGARGRYGYAPADRVVVFAGNELERKGFDTLLRAVARLDDPRARILVVGRSDPSEFAALAATLGLSDRITFAGSSEDIAHEYAAADVFALPTRYEPWGLVIVEGLASGLPVLTTALAGAAVAVREGLTGCLLADPEDAAGLAAQLAWAFARTHDSAAISATVDWLRWPNVIAAYVAYLEEAS